MAANRVGPTDPNKDRSIRGPQEEHRKIEQVEKVGEVENEQTRKKFKRFMEEEPEETQQKTPSPLETGFYKQAPKVSSSSLAPPAPSIAQALGSYAEDVVPDPSYSVPPRVQMSSPSPQSSQSSPLPRNQDFWDSTDTSSHTESAQNTYQEVSSSGDSGAKGKEAKSSAKKEKKKEEPLSLAPKQEGHKKAFVPEVSPLKAEEKMKLEKKEKKSKEPAAAALPAETLAQGPSGAPHPSESKRSPLKDKKKGAHLHERAPLMAQGTPLHSAKSQKFQDAESDSGQKRRDKHSNAIEIDSPSIAQLPAHVVPMAEAAASQATPYLSPETVPLFYQMVGTIYVMGEKSGISTTQILLNAPGFAKSPFFGSTISIERYATAPDSLNIRLLGTNEAVTTFQQNIPSLYAAFQNGNFSFRIGRISAEYETSQKPLFRRKEEKERPGGESKEGRGHK